MQLSQFYSSPGMRENIERASVRKDALVFGNSTCHRCGNNRNSPRHRAAGCSAKNLAESRRRNG